MYRKYKPETIFTGRKMLPGGQVLLVKEDGSVENIVTENEAGDDVEVLSGILTPGFVNAHCHIELSHLKGVIPKHTGLVEFVRQVIFKRDRPFEESGAEEHFETILDFKHAAMNRAVEELYRSGTVAIGDICNTADSLELKIDSSLYWQNFIEVSGFVDAVAGKRLKAAEEIFWAFVKSTKSNRTTLTPHSPYSVSKTLFNLLNGKTAGQLISIHNQETSDENNLYRNKSGEFLELYKDLGIHIAGFLATGKSSLQSWLPYFNNGQKIISVHNTFINQEDLAASKLQSSAAQLFFCICVNANLYIENMLPPIDLLMKNNCSIVLGTDSYASNTQLNMMEEINSIQKYFPHLSLETILQWATLNGARALGMENTYGSFDKGKKPGLVLVKAGIAERLL